MNGTLSLVSQRLVDEEIRDAGRMLTREGEQTAQGRFVLHMRGKARFAGTTGETGDDGVPHERIGAFFRGHGEEVFLGSRLPDFSKRDGRVETDA